MCLVDDEHSPMDGSQRGGVAGGKLVRCQENIELGFITLLQPARLLQLVKGSLFVAKIPLSEEKTLQVFNTLCFAGKVAAACLLLDSRK